MARPKTETIIDDANNIPNEVAEQLTSEQFQVSTECQLAVEQYGDGVPFDELTYQNKVAFHLKRSAEEMLEGCKALLVTRVHLDNGRWGEFLKRIGLEDRLARRMVSTARKFSGAEMKPLVQAAGNKTKLFELLVLDDEDLVKVAQGEEDAPVALDDVARMSTTELRDSLREARADNQATKKVLEDKNKKLDQMQAQLEKAAASGKADRPKTDYNVKQVRADLHGDLFELELVLKRVTAGLLALRDCDLHYDQQARESLTKMHGLFTALAAELSLDFENPESTSLAWLPDPSVIDDADFGEELGA